MHNKLYCLVFIAGMVIYACNNSGSGNQQNRTDPAADDTVVKKDTMPPPPEIAYSFVKRKEWVNKKDSFEGAQHLDILIAINRTDSSHIKWLDSILVPNRYDLPVRAYMPFPETVDFLKNVQKIIVFSNPAQAFAAYENGKMIYQGQTNSGKKATPTPPKLYFCNWKARRSVSTSNRSWILNWNFNISNTMGIGFHQYALPGYPASHSCLRLQNADAFFMYNWADQWVLKNGIEMAKGTPVIVYNQYPFGAPRPWYALAENPAALTLNEDSLKNMVSPHLETILQKQDERFRYIASVKNDSL